METCHFVCFLALHAWLLHKKTRYSYWGSEYKSVAHLNLFIFCRSISTSKVTILGYGLLTTDARPLLEALNKQRFGVILVDESHYLKSRNAARSKILVPIIQNAKRAILLTGTPALGRPEEVRFPPNLFVICFDLLSHLVICSTVLFELNQEEILSLADIFPILQSSLMSPKIASTIIS